MLTLTMCPTCNGLGDDNVKHEFNRCLTCDGTGKVEEQGATMAKKRKQPDDDDWTPDAPAEDADDVDSDDADDDDADE